MRRARGLRLRLGRRRRGARGHRRGLRGSTRRGERRGRDRVARGRRVVQGREALRQAPRGLRRGAGCSRPTTKSRARSSATSARRAAGWTPPRSTRTPRDHNDEALPEYAQRRARVVDRLRDTLLVAAEEAELAPVDRRPVFEDLLKLNPDDPNTRHLLGEGRKGDRWVLLEVLRSDERRGELSRSVQESFAVEIPFRAVEANAREASLGFQWDRRLRHAGRSRGSARSRTTSCVEPARCSPRSGATS